MASKLVYRLARYSTRQKNVAQKSRDLEKEREESIKKEIKDYNRDIQKHFDVKYSATSEARRAVRVRYQLKTQDGDFTMTDMRSLLFNYLFAHSELMKGEGRFILQVDDTGDFSQRNLNSQLELIKRLGISWDEGPLSENEAFRNSYRKSQSQQFY